MILVSRSSIIPKTAASSAKLSAVTALIEPFMKTEEQAMTLAVAIAEFAEQAIRDFTAPAVVPDVEDGPITVPIESAGYPAHYRHGWRDAMAAIRAEGRGALDVAVLAEAAMLAFHERKWSVQEYAGAEPAWTWQSVAAAILGEYDRLAQREPAS